MKFSALHSFTPFFENFADAGGGAGVGAGSVSPGAGAGAAAGADQGAGGQPGAGTGAGAGASGARTIGDNDMVLIDGKPVRWADARGTHYMPRDTYDRGVDFLKTMAQQIDARMKSGAQGNAGGQRTQQQQQQQPHRDPFADVENQPVVDGRTFAKLGRELIQNGFGQIGQVITQLATRVQQLETGTQGIGRTVGSLAENHSNNEFETFVTTTLKGVPEIPGLGMIPTDNELIRELAKDLFLSHDQKDPTLMKEFPRMMQERVSNLFKLFTTMQKGYVDTQKNNRRQFFNPAGGNARPSGGPKYVHESPEQIARKFFDATGDSRT